MNLTHEEAELLERVLIAATPPVFPDLPEAISATLLARGVLSKLGPSALITQEGIQALVRHRLALEKSSKRGGDEV